MCVCVCDDSWSAVTQTVTLHFFPPEQAAGWKQLIEVVFVRLCLIMGVKRLKIKQIRVSFMNLTRRTCHICIKYKKDWTNETKSMNKKPGMNKNEEALSYYRQSVIVCLCFYMNEDKWIIWHQFYASPRVGVYRIRNSSEKSLKSNQSDVKTVKKTVKYRNDVTEPASQHLKPKLLK